MPVHALVEATAEPGRLGEIVDAARTFLERVQEREAHAERAEAYTIDGTRTLIVHLVFEDALAAEEHRTAKQTTAFTETLDEACQTVDLHELSPVHP